MQTKKLHTLLRLIKNKCQYDIQKDEKITLNK